MIDEVIVQKRDQDLSKQKVKIIEFQIMCFSKDYQKQPPDILPIPITQICNLFIKFSHFPKDCKVAKLKPLYKKILKQILKILGQSPFFR